MNLQPRVASNKVKQRYCCVTDASLVQGEKMLLSNTLGLKCLKLIWSRFLKEIQNKMMIP